ncbi:hypothetical protein LZ30DRAFT_420061 [Colletotrichum cereale]|nr:hypothetical protein LZ30DRAFT_420061 [Colletotrichum cereale]
MVLALVLLDAMHPGHRVGRGEQRVSQDVEESERTGQVGADDCQEGVQTGQKGPRRRSNEKTGWRPTMMQMEPWMRGHRSRTSVTAMTGRAPLGRRDHPPCLEDRHVCRVCDVCIVITYCWSAARTPFCQLRWPWLTVLRPRLRHLITTGTYCLSYLLLH